MEQYKTAKTRVIYHINFQTEDKGFHVSYKNPLHALEVVKELITSNCNPKISREILYDTPNLGNPTNPKKKDITIKKLEEIVCSQLIHS